MADRGDRSVDAECMVGEALGELRGDTEGELSESARFSSSCVVSKASAEIADIGDLSSRGDPLMLVRAATAVELRGDAATCVESLRCMVALRCSRLCWMRVLSLEACRWI